MYAIKLELKLNNIERSYLAGCAGYARLVYNYGLDLIKSSWSFEGIKVGDGSRLAAIKKILTNQVMVSDKYKWMKKYPSTIYQSALNNLGKAFRNYRSGLGKLPVFKAKKDGDSFTVYKSSGIYPSKGSAMIPFSNRQGIQAGKKIRIPGLGVFRLKEELPFTCSSQTFTISRSSNKWYVSFTIDAEKIPAVIQKNELVGIDLGVKAFATLSTGKVYEMPKTLKEAKTKLSQFQWANRNKQLGNRKKKIKASNRAKKFSRQLAKKHSRVSNIRKDFLHKTTTNISRENFRIRIEDLNVSGMLANCKLSEAVANQGFYEFRRQLEYKQNFYGTKVEIVDKWYPSSKTCSSCGHQQPIKLSERIFYCQSCNSQIDRDLNASINLAFAPVNKVRLA